MRQGFSIFELLIVVAIIGLATTLTLPRLIRRAPKSEWPVFLEEMNNLVAFARQESIALQRDFVLHFKAATDESPATVTLEKEKDFNVNPYNPEFEPYKGMGVATVTVFPKEITLVACFKGRTNQLEGKKKEAFCHIIPSGIVEDFMLHCARNDGTHKTLTMVPFFGRFDMVSGLTKPEKSS